MSSLSPRLQVRVQQKQILTPGLVQMVSLLQLNRLELKEMISAGEIEAVESDRMDFEAANMGNPEPATLEPSSEPATAPDAADTKATDPFEEIDFGSYFDDYLDPGYKSPASENVEKPSFETFLSSPVTLTDHLRSQLALVSLTEEVRDAAESIIGNLNENGYLTTTAEEMAAAEGHKLEDVLEALRVVHTLDPAGVGCADVRECLLLQIDSRNGKGGVAWQIVHDHLTLVAPRRIKELARVLHRPIEHIQIAVDVIRHLDP